MDPKHRSLRYRWRSGTTARTKWEYLPRDHVSPDGQGWLDDPLVFRVV